MTLYFYRCRDCGTTGNTLDPHRDVRCGECEEKFQRGKEERDGKVQEDAETETPDS